MVLEDSTSPREPAYRIESVDKALRLLWLLRDERRLTVSEVSERLGVARSTAHRLLGMLQVHGFAQQDPATKAYMPGRALFEVGLGALASLDVRREARPELERLVREIRETVLLIVLQGPRTLVVDSFESDAVVRVSVRAGGSMPAHCVSAGKVLLSQMKPECVRALLGPEPLESRTEDSITTYAELEPELEEVRAQGYATNFNESEPGVSAFSVPVPAPVGVVPTTVTVLVPSTRMTLRRLPTLVVAAQAAATRVGEAVEKCG
jgi:IclR family acetate operon transcriptional repressor